jgi:PAS domain S-box-containing protein
VLTSGGCGIGMTAARRKPRRPRDRGVRSSAASTAFLTALIGSLQDGVMAEDSEGRIVVVNAAFCRMFDLGPPERLTGRNAWAIRERLWEAYIEDVAGFRRLTEALRRSRRPQFGYEVQLSDGRIFDRDYVPVASPDGTVAHLWHYHDVTSRRALEKSLRESRRRLRQLSAHAEAVREEERRHLARTLHDELGQLFSSMRMELGAAIAMFRTHPDPALRPVVDRLQATVGLADLAVASLRGLTTALRPPVLDHLDFVGAIRWEASLFSKRTGIRSHVRARPDPIHLADPHVTALYRILCGALENIAKHAAAGSVWIAVERSHRETRLEIRDNGRGIRDEEIDNPRTMGLLGMRERALALGGAVHISAGPRGGTRVVVTLPGGGERARSRNGGRDEPERRRRTGRTKQAAERDA